MTQTKWPPRNPARFSLDFQLKASTRWALEDQAVVYDLEASTYNDLVTRLSGNTLILILLCLPREEAEWHVASATELILRHACYWFRPTGPETANDVTIRIRIPRSNLLTVTAIGSLMNEARAREVSA